MWKTNKAQILTKWVSGQCFRTVLTVTSLDMKFMEVTVNTEKTKDQRGQE